MASLGGAAPGVTARNPDPKFMPVAERVCDRCLLGSNPLVDARRRAEILAECASSGQAFLCHKGTMAGEYIVCRSFYERGMSLSVRLARMLGRARFVRLPG